MKLLKFYADWCGPCKQQTKILEGLPLNMEVEAINVEDEDSSSLVEKYGIRNIPVLIFLEDDGTEIKRFNGLTMAASLKEFINNE